jgi:hypothetical protein
MEILIKLDTPAGPTAPTLSATPAFDRSAATDAGAAPADLLQALGEVPAAETDQQNAGEPSADLLGTLHQGNGQALSAEAGPAPAA